MNAKWWSWEDFWQIDLCLHASLEIKNDSQHELPGHWVLKKLFFCGDQDINFGIKFIAGLILLLFLKKILTLVYYPHTDLYHDWAICCLSEDCITIEFSLMWWPMWAESTWLWLQIFYFPDIRGSEPQRLFNFLLILPMIVSLRGRCLEVMTCREGAMDWMRMIGWLGS